MPPHRRPKSAKDEGKQDEAPHPTAEAAATASAAAAGADHLSAFDWPHMRVHVVHTLQSRDDGGSYALGRVSVLRREAGSLHVAMTIDADDGQGQGPSRSNHVFVRDLLRPTTTTTTTTADVYLTVNWPDVGGALVDTFSTPIGLVYDAANARLLVGEYSCRPIVSLTGIGVMDKGRTRRRSFDIHDVPEVYGQQHSSKPAGRERQADDGRRSQLRVCVHR